MTLETVIKEKKGSIIDVRTPEEFKNGYAEGAINIPLLEIPEKIYKIKYMPEPFVLCCSSGTRSELAHNYLTKQGYECLIAGSWTKINDIHNKN
jgi:rhodanese-related sulfurtransferase